MHALLMVGARSEHKYSAAGALAVRHVDATAVRSGRMRRVKKADIINCDDLGRRADGSAASPNRPPHCWATRSPGGNRPRSASP